MTNLRRLTDGRRSVIGCLAIAGVAAGCLTTERLLQARDEGAVRCYRSNFDIVWQAIGRSVRLNGLRVEQSEPRERYLVARSGPEPEPRDVEDLAVDANAGERIAVFVDSAAPGVWAVRVVSRAEFALDPARKNWTSDVFEAIERALPESARRPWHYEYPACVGPRVPADSASSRRESACRAGPGPARFAPTCRARRPMDRTSAEGARRAGADIR